jgi:hypothetical protein
MMHPRRLRSAVLALAMLGIACSDAVTAPNGTQETVLISLVGLTSDDAGVLLHLIGGADDVEPAGVSLEVAWATDAANTATATVAVVGPLSESGDVLLIRRRAGLQPLRVEVREVAGADGALSSPSAVRAILRAARSP